MNTIKKLRKERGLSQQALAIEVHVHQTAVSQWETGRHFPDMAQAIELAAFFNVTTDYILGRTDDPSPLGQKKEAAANNDDELTLTEEELEHIRLYRAASPELQAAALAMLEAAERARLAGNLPSKDI